MSTISSFANYGTSSNLYRTRAEALDFKPASDTVMTSEPQRATSEQRVQPTFKVETGDNQQAYDEALARMLVNLNAITQEQEQAEPTFSIGSELGFRDEPLAEETATDPDDALAQFMAYMDMSPAEKMRDKVLNEIGMSEEELAALPPEQQELIEKQIAERMQTLQELQASQDENPDSLHAQAWSA